MPLPSDRRTPLVSALAVAVALGVAGCGEEATRGTAPPAEPGAATATRAPAPGIEPDAEEEPRLGAVPAQRRVATLEHDGETFEAEFGGAGQLPSSFPDDVPIYAGAEPQSSLATVARGTYVTLLTTDEPRRVFEFYRAELEAAGWRVESESEARGQYQLRTRKGNRRSSVTIASQPGLTQIRLAIGEDR